MTITKPNLVYATGRWDRFPRTQALLQEVTGRHAADYHDGVEALLKKRGWNVKREYAVAVDGHGGRIDLVAYKGDWKIALELDNRTPRSRSIEKLKQFTGLPYWLTGILLRDPR